MFAQLIICTNNWKSAAEQAFVITPLPTRNFVSTDILKFRENTDLLVW